MGSSYYQVQGKVDKSFKYCKNINFNIVDPFQPVQSRPTTAQVPEVPRNPDDYAFTDPHLAKDYRKLYEQFQKMQAGDFGLGLTEMTASSDPDLAEEDDKSRDNAARTT